MNWHAHICVSSARAALAATVSAARGPGAGALTARRAATREATTATRVRPSGRCKPAASRATVAGTRTRGATCCKDLEPGRGPPEARRTQKRGTSGAQPDVPRATRALACCPPGAGPKTAKVERPARGAEHVPII